MIWDHKNMRYRWLMPFTMLLLAGCWGGNEASVSGIITLDGTPMDTGLISFDPDGPGKLAAAQVQSDGSYFLRTNRESGLAVGGYAVTVFATEPGKVDPRGGPTLPGKSITPEYYANKETSGLHFEVTAGTNVIDIELSSKSRKAGMKSTRRRR